MQRHKAKGISILLEDDPFTAFQTQTGQAIIFDVTLSVQNCKELETSDH